MQVVKAEPKREAMAVKNGGSALRDLSTLFNVGVIGALTDGQLLERFANGRGEARELAFAALVERHGPFVFRVCRAVLRDDHSAHDAFQATFLALARKAASLWVHDSLAPWLHQAAYRAACHDRSAIMRRHSRERAVAVLRPEKFIPHDHGDGEIVARIIHQEVDRLPPRYRVAVVLCDLEGRTHEQAARHLGCAVGTVKSRLARGRKTLRGRLIRRGVAPATALAAAHAATTARAVVPTALAESTVVCAATAGAVPTSVAGITQGVLISMFLSKFKMAMTGMAIVTALTAGAVAVAQQGTRPPNDAASRSGPTASPTWTYQILASRDGEPPRKVAVVEMTDDTPIRVDAPGALITFQPKRTSGTHTSSQPGQVFPRRQYADIPTTVDEPGASPFKLQRAELLNASKASNKSITSEAWNPQAAQPANSDPDSNKGNNSQARQPADQNQKAPDKQAQKSSQSGDKSQNAPDRSVQKPSQSADQNQKATDGSAPNSRQSKDRNQKPRDSQSQKPSQSADRDPFAANPANERPDSPPQVVGEVKRIGPNHRRVDLTIGSDDGLVRPTKDGQSKANGAENSDTNHRLDQLEKKVDLILEALKAMGRPPADSPHSDQ
jgi:RNA polymerase sigma factor (sigma-70 family)